MASAALTSFSFSTGQSLKAPPEAVRMMRRSPPSGSPWMHWKMAYTETSTTSECSPEGDSHCGQCLATGCISGGKAQMLGTHHNVLRWKMNDRHALVRCLRKALRLRDRCYDVLLFGHQQDIHSTSYEGGNCSAGGMQPGMNV